MLVGLEVSLACVLLCGFAVGGSVEEMGHHRDPVPGLAYSVTKPLMDSPSVVWGERAAVPALH